MYERESNAPEASTHLGAGLMIIGLGVLFLNFHVPVFTSWMWALVISGTWIAFGTLFLYPDIRLYQFDESPLEQLLYEESSDS